MVDAVGSDPAAFGCEGSSPSLGTHVFTASWWNGRHAGSKLRCFRASRFESERGYGKREGAPMWCPFLSGPAGIRIPVQPTVLGDVYVCSPLFFTWAGRLVRDNPSGLHSRLFRQGRSGHPPRLALVCDNRPPTKAPWVRSRLAN